MPDDLNNTSEDKYVSSLWHNVTCKLAPTLTLPCVYTGGALGQKCERPTICTMWGKPRYKMVSRGGSSPLPCVILRDEYLFFLAALIKYGVNPEAPTTGNCFLAGGPQKSFARSSDSQTDYARPGCRITNPLSHRCHGGPRRAQITEWTTSELENVSTWGCHPSWCVCPYVGGILICPNPSKKFVWCTS